MRTEAECLAMATALERQAETCGASHETAYRAMAETWRHVARQARWQDTPAMAALLA
jgi:hypothetical protein